VSFTYIARPPCLRGACGPLCTSPQAWVASLFFRSRLILNFHPNTPILPQSPRPASPPPHSYHPSPLSHPRLLPPSIPGHIPLKDSPYPTQVHPPHLPPLVLPLPCFLLSCAIIIGLLASAPRRRAVHCATPRISPFFFSPPHLLPPRPVVPQFLPPDTPPTPFQAMTPDPPTSPPRHPPAFVTPALSTLLPSRPLSYPPGHHDATLSTPTHLLSISRDFTLVEDHTTVFSANKPNRMINLVLFFSWSKAPHVQNSISSALPLSSPPALFPSPPIYPPQLPLFPSLLVPNAQLNSIFSSSQHPPPLVNTPRLFHFLPSSSTGFHNPCSDSFYLLVGSFLGALKFFCDIFPRSR